MKLLQQIDRLVWGIPMLMLILGVGLRLTWKTNAVQLRLLPRAVRHFLGGAGKESKDGTTPFQALCTALAATVGTGNIAGVAGAIAIGGPGSVFWMWLSALVGMGTKFAEATLAVRYRVRDAGGTVVGGPMYMIRQGMGKRWHWLAGLYSFLGVTAAFGVGNATQINTVMTQLREAAAGLDLTLSRRGEWGIALILAALVGAVLLGGCSRIGRAAEKLVPFSAVLYLGLGMGVIILRADALPAIFSEIFKGALTPRAVTGGAVGSWLTALRTGVSRGVFSNEAGMGTAAIAHASASVTHPAQQGLMGMMEVLIDTILICTMTALVILCSGVPVPYGQDPGAALTARAFSEIYGSWVGAVLALAVCCFAFATVLGWGLYGIRCAQYLFGTGAFRWFSLLQVIMVLLGALLQTGVVWLAADIVNGLMAIPNLIALLALTPELVRLTREYEKKSACPIKTGQAGKNQISGDAQSERM